MALKLGFPKLLAANSSLTKLYDSLPGTLDIKEAVPPPPVQGLFLPGLPNFTID